MAPYEQARHHPYSQSMVEQGQLGLHARFHEGLNGQKEHPDWKFQESKEGDVQLRSSDGISFWVGDITGYSA